MAEEHITQGVQRERTALFIDGASLYLSARALRIFIDYEKLLTHYQGQGNVVQAFYYNTLQVGHKSSPIRTLVDWLDHHGYTTLIKPVREFANDNGQRQVESGVDIEIILDMLEMAPDLDHAVLFSGSGDLRRLVETVQRKGVRVTVVSTIRSPIPMAAPELRRRADRFDDLADLAALIARDRAEKCSDQGVSP